MQTGMFLWGFVGRHLLFDEIVDVSGVCLCSTIMGLSPKHGVDMLEIVRVATPCKQTTCGFSWHMHALDNACYYF